jgi:hypothetical protein
MYSLSSPSSDPITLFAVGAPSEPGANPNTYTELEPKDILLTATLNPELLKESVGVTSHTPRIYFS